MAADKRIVFVLICLSNITISFNIAAIAAVVPTISADLQLPDFLVAQIIPYYLVPYGIGALIYAPLTKRYSYRAILIVSMFFFAASCLACGFVTDINHFFVARMAMGVAAASAIPLGLLMIGEFFEKTIRGRLVGLFFSCSFFATLAGLVLSGIAHWRLLFLVPAILGIIMMAAAAFLGGELLGKVHGATINYFKALKQKDIQKVFLFIFCVSFLYHGVHKWFGVYLSRVYGLDQLSISFFFILAAIGGLSGQLLGGVISDKHGRLSSCYLGVIGLGVATMLLIGHYSQVILGCVLVAVSMFWTVGHNGLSTALTDFPDRDRAVIASLNSSVRFISGGLGFYISSFFVKSNFGLTFFVFGLVILLSGLTLKRIVPNHV